VPERASLSAALRRQGWIIVAGVVAGGALFGTASALSSKAYESRVEVQLTPVSLEQRFGAPDAPTTPAQAIAREMDLVRSAAVLGRADAQISFDHGLVAEQVSDDTVAFVGRSISGPYAESVANTAATTYLTVRQENATGQANSSVAFTQGVVDDLTARQAAGEDVAADLAEQQARLTDFQAGLDAAAETARVTLGPTDAGGPISPHPWEAAAKGALVGLVAGLLVAALREYARARPLPHDIAGSLPTVVVTRRDGAPVRLGWADRRRPAFVALTSLVVGRAAVYAYNGANFVLDDWSLEYQRATAGAWSSVPGGQDLVHARPGAWLTFTLLHGIVGPHPLIQFAVLTAVNVGVVLVLYLVLSRFFDRPTALLVAAVWTLLPIHQSMSVWSGTSQIAVGVLLFLLGAWAFTYGRWLLAGLGLAASILCYELTVPAAFAATVLIATPLVPLLASAAPPRAPITLLTRAKTLVFVVLATAWSRAHPVYDLELRMPSPATLWSGHFGLGIFGDLDAPEKLVMLVGGLVAAGVAVCLVWWLAGERGHRDGPSLVVAGLGVFLLGLVVSFTATTGVLGFNDRLYSMSSIGAAMMLSGLGVFLWRRVPMITAGLTGLLLIAVVVGQLLSLQSWSQAGGDVVALLNYLERTYPDPAHTNFIVGPSPRYRNNVLGASSPFGGADSAFRLTFPDAGPPCEPAPAECQASLVIAASAEEFVPTDRGETLVDWSRVLGADGLP
jgi:ElaB/YqjD/DUF883 family membrane-anchored ribosome-binding protein